MEASGLLPMKGVDVGVGRPRLVQKLAKPAGERGERNLGGKACSSRTPDPGEGMHDESEAVNRSHEMLACWFPYEETPAGAAKPVIISTHRGWERAGGRQLWSRVRMGTARRKVAGGLSGLEQGDLLRAHLFPCLFPHAVPLGTQRAFVNILWV